MSEHALLDLVRAANPVPDSETLPEGTIDVRTLRNYVANTPAIGLARLDELDTPHALPSGVPARRGLWLAAAVFIAVLALGLGFWFARSSTEPDVVEPPQVTTTLPPPTTAPPTTAAVEAGSAVDPEALAVIDEFVAVLDGRDAAVAAGLVSADAGAVLIDRITTADEFDDGYELGDCLAFDDVIRCDVLVSDFFTNQLDIEPWPQTWELQVGEGTITTLDLTGDSPEVQDARAAFEDFVAGRDPEVGPLTSSAGDWVRSAGVVEVVGPHLVEFAALRSGIPPETWATIAAYFTTLSAGDLDAFEALLASEALFEERWGPNSELRISYTRDQPEFLGHFWFEYLGLKTDTRPLTCTGDAAFVSCRVRNIGVLQLDSRGFDDGPLLFELEDERITAIRDAFSVPTLRPGFYDGWIFENGPDMTGQWTGTSTDIPETPEVAALLLEWYPRYLAGIGVDVPPEYLDGSLLEE